MPRLVLAIGLLAAAAARAEPPPEVLALQRAFHKVYDEAKPSVACVLVSRSDKYADLGEGPSAAVPGKLGGFNTPRPGKLPDGPRKDLVKRLDLANPETVPEGYGTGVVIDPSGLVLTNYHVIEKATKVYVRLPGAGRGSYADIHAADGRSDLAVLRMISPPADLRALPIGDGGKAREGDLVVGLSNPFAAGFRDGNPSFSWGAVSNVRRRVPGPSDEAKRAKPLNQYPTLLQTTVQQTVGVSGGALLNLDGELIGLTTGLAALTGGEAAGGYAIPTDANVRKMIDVLKRGEEIEYGFLGVTVNPEGRSDGRGVVVMDVAPGLPAARAGLRGGDVVTAINGSPVREQEDLFLQISAALAGTEATIDVRRLGGAQTFRVRLAKQPLLEWADKVIASSRPRAVFGLRVDYTSTLALDANPPEGVLVKELDPGTPAEKKLKAWADRARLLVTAVDGKAISSPADFYKAAAGKASVTLDVTEANRESETPRQRVTLP